MAASSQTNPQMRLPQILRDTLVSLVRREGADLTSRQLAVLLICYLDEGPHTVRGLAARLEVAKPAITRALDRLERFDLAQRRPDPRDGRSIVVAATSVGEGFMAQLRVLMAQAARPGDEPRGAARSDGERTATG